MNDHDDDNEDEPWGIAENGPYRGGRVHVLAGLCGTCVFHPGNRMRLRPGRLAQMVAEAVARDSAITCHSTLDGDARAVCRGYFDGPGRQVWTLRVAIAMGVVEFDPVPTKECA